MSRWDYAIAAVLCLMAINLIAAYILHRKARRAWLKMGRDLGFLPDEQIAHLERASDRCTLAAMLLALLAVSMVALSVLNVSTPF